MIDACGKKRVFVHFHWGNSQLTYPRSPQDFTAPLEVDFCWHILSNSDPNLEVEAKCSACYYYAPLTLLSNFGQLQCSSAEAIQKQPQLTSCYKK